MVDEATNLCSCNFNNVVIRKALKSLVTQDVHLRNWKGLTKDTLEIIESRFLPDGDDGVSSMDFFIILVTQNFSKLIRAATSKMRAKELKFLKYLQIVIHKS